MPYFDRKYFVTKMAQLVENKDISYMSENRFFVVVIIEYTVS